MIRRLWRQNRWLLIGFLVGMVVTVFFGARAAMFTIYWSDPEHRDQAVAAWMTPRYVAYSWDVPPEVVAEALGLDRDGTGRRETIGALAQNRGIPVSELAGTLTQAILDYRATE